MKSQKENSVKEQNSTCDNNVLCEVFGTKIIIAGTIIFEPYLSEIQKCFFYQMIYSKNEEIEVLNDLESKGLDYIILPNFKGLFYSKNYGVQDKINKIRTMCENAGWGLDF